MKKLRQLQVVTRIVMPHKEVTTQPMSSTDVLIPTQRNMYGCRASAPRAIWPFFFTFYNYSFCGINYYQ